MAEEKFTAKEWASRMGKARAAALTPKQRKEIARKAIETRWEAYYKAHPEKSKEKKTREGIKKRGKKEAV
jgi:nitroimidazol reductase NimA-like FMN-containing flavoprotein (pyridoxamine 5'-phosphate oxidase superfamily)